MEITPKEAMEMLLKGKGELLEGLVDGRYWFADKYIHNRHRIVWTPWPHIETYVEVSDGEHTFIME